MTSVTEVRLRHECKRTGCIIHKRATFGPGPNGVVGWLSEDITIEDPTAPAVRDWSPESKQARRFA